MYNMSQSICRWLEYTYVSTKDLNQDHFFHIHAISDLFLLEVELVFPICHQKLQAVNPVLGGLSIRSNRELQCVVRTGSR